MRDRALILRLLAGLALLLALPAVARAHPHVFVEARATLLFDAQGRLEGVRHAWTFDEMFSSFAKQGLDANRDGRFSREELQPLAEVNVTSLAEFAYFTFVRAGERDLAFAEPRDHYLEHHDATGVLTLHVTLPLREPVRPEGRTLSVRVFDPEYFVAFDMAEATPVTLRAAPARCRFELRRPQELDEGAAAELAQIPATIRALPAPLALLTAGLANEITLVCP